MLWPRWIWLRALGLIFLSAFYSLAFQIRGLNGPRGILPAGDYLHELRSAVGLAEALWVAPTLFWLNGLYLRVTGFWEAFEDPDEPPRRLRGPLESLLVGSLYLAVVAFLIWFFAFARNPQPDIAF